MISHFIGLLTRRKKDVPDGLDIMVSAHCTVDTSPGVVGWCSPVWDGAVLPSHHDSHCIMKQDTEHDYPYTLQTYLAYAQSQLKSSSSSSSLSSPRHDTSLHQEEEEEKKPDDNNAYNTFISSWSARIPRAVWRGRCTGGRLSQIGEYEKTGMLEMRMKLTYFT
jgi:hypothetical protein